MINPRSAAGPHAGWRIAALLVLACGLDARAQPAVPEMLPAAMRAALAKAGIAADSVAFVVMPMQRGGPVFAHRAEVAMQPGSTMKLVTSVVALDRLGLTEHGHTELLSDAAQVGDVLLGDLVLRGGADPELGLPQLWQMLFELRQQGVREIAGDLVIDRNLFRPARIDQGLPPFDETPEFSYNDIPDALQLNGNLLDFELKSDAASLSVRTIPELPGIRVTQRMSLVDKPPCADWDDVWKPPLLRPAVDGGGVDIELQGQFPRDCSVREGLLLVDRSLLAEAYVRLLWTQLGGSIRGQTREAAAPVTARERVRHDARPWAAVLRAINKPSDNALARLLFLSLGLPGMAADSVSTTRKLADAAVHRWFVDHRISDRGLVVDNGSGLSRSERIAPMQMARMLQIAAADPKAADLLASLPVVGVDGTMRHRLRDSVAAGRARIKTGTLRNVVAVAGIVPDRSNRQWIVVAMVNDEKANPGGRAALDALVDWVAQSGAARAPAPPRPGRPQASGH